MTRPIVKSFFEDYEKQKADPKKYPPNLGLFDDDKVKPDPTEKEKPELFKKYKKQPPAPPQPGPKAP